MEFNQLKHKKKSSYVLIWLNFQYILLIAKSQIIFLKKSAYEKLSFSEIIYIYF